MTNSNAVKNLCNAIASSFYPDSAAVEFVLANQGLDPMAECTPVDPKLFRAAKNLVIGYVEGSRSEAGVSVSVDRKTVKASLLFWCRNFFLDPAEELDGVGLTIENASNLW